MSGKEEEDVGEKGGYNREAGEELVKLLGQSGILRNQDIESIRSMLKAKANPNYEPEPPLHLAIRQLRPDIIKILLESKADPSHAGRASFTPLMEALGRCRFTFSKFHVEHAVHTEVLDLLLPLLKPEDLSRGRHEDGSSPLVKAFSICCTDVVLRLVESKCAYEEDVRRLAKRDPKVVGEPRRPILTRPLSSSSSPRHSLSSASSSSSSSSSSAASPLLSLRTSDLTQQEFALMIGKKDPGYGCGTTLAHLAASNFDTQAGANALFKALLLCKCDFEAARDARGQTPLHAFINHHSFWSDDRARTLHLLCVNKCDPNARDSLGNTALHYLASGARLLQMPEAVTSLIHLKVFFVFVPFQSIDYECCI